MPLEVLAIKVHAQVAFQIQRIWRQTRNPYKVIKNQVLIEAILSRVKGEDKKAP
jgi:hypothetical protein